MKAVDSKKYGVWLWALLGLFCFRVAAQLVQWRFEAPLLPPFDAWHSSVVPYAVLLAVQVVIIAFYGRVSLAFWSRSVEPSRRSAALWLSIGSVYGIVMAARLVLGMTVLSSQAWFANWLPTLFHLVLASFMLVAGTFHWRHVARESRALSP